MEETISLVPTKTLIRIKKDLEYDDGELSEKVRKEIERELARRSTSSPRNLR